jgi:hypothetical protein
MILTKRHLKLLIQNVITETSQRLSTISVDDQIDSILINFESESTAIQEKKYSLISSLQFLFEQDTDEQDTDDKTTDDKTTDDKIDTEGSKDVDVSEPVEPAKPPLNLNEFAMNVARLVENHENLLDVRTVIIIRAINYIKENYDEAASNNLRDLLESQHNVVPTGDYIPEPLSPMAVGAGKVPA